MPDYCYANNPFENTAAANLPTVIDLLDARYSEMREAVYN